MPRDYAPHEPDVRHPPTELERDLGERAQAGEACSDRPRDPLPGRSPEERAPAFPFRDGRAVLYDRDRGYRLSESEIRTVAELGKFRIVAADDLAEFSYGGSAAEAGRDARNLIRLGLVRKQSFQGPEALPRELLTLTRRGYRLLRASRLVPPAQAAYYGFARQREASHDAALYRLYRKEAARIEAQGGRKLSVLLDYELKRRINREIAKLGPQARPEIAARHGLEVVGNKIPVPDLRIEYETRDGEMARVNLELVTEHYRRRHVAEKLRAGFSLYTPRGEADQLRRILDERELTAEILSL